MNNFLSKIELQHFINICKRIDQGSINNIVSTIKEKNDQLENFYTQYQITPDEFVSLTSLNSYFGNNTESVLNEIYEKYYKMKGGAYVMKIKKQPDCLKRCKCVKNDVGAYDVTAMKPKDEKEKAFCKICVDDYSCVDVESTFTKIAKGAIKVGKDIVGSDAFKEVSASAVEAGKKSATEVVQNSAQKASSHINAKIDAAAAPKPINLSVSGTQKQLTPHTPKTPKQHKIPKPKPAIPIVPVVSPVAIPVAKTGGYDISENSQTDSDYDYGNIHNLLNKSKIEIPYSDFTEYDQGLNTINTDIIQMNGGGLNTNHDLNNEHVQITNVKNMFGSGGDADPVHSALTEQTGETPRLTDVFNSPNSVKIPVTEDNSEFEPFSQTEETSVNEETPVNEQAPINEETLANTKPIEKPDIDSAFTAFTASEESLANTESIQKSNDDIAQTNENDIITEEQRSNLQALFD